MDPVSQNVAPLPQKAPLNAGYPFDRAPIEVKGPVEQNLSVDSGGFQAARANSSRG
jgi:hypothetical protein